MDMRYARFCGPLTLCGAARRGSVNGPLTLCGAVRGRSVNKHSSTLLGCQAGGGGGM